MTYPSDLSQTSDKVRARWSAADNAVVGFLPQQSYGRRIVLMELLGPSNTTLTIYRGPQVIAGFRVVRVFPGSARTYDSIMEQSPILVRAMEQWAWAWTGGAASALAPNNTAECTVISQVIPS